MNKPQEKSTNETPEVSNIAERQDRLKRLEEIKKLGLIPYADKYEMSHKIGVARTLPVGTEVSVAGRIILLRNMGKIAFIQLQDITGKIQIIFRAGEIEEAKCKQFVKLLDRGDFIGVKGQIFTTEKGEISVMVKEYVFLSKALLPLPEKWHGLQDTEIKYRQRYLDLVLNEETRQRFIIRSKFVQSLREWLLQNNFMEVMTRTLQSVAGGAMAETFKTHHNALDEDFSLRIAPELDLKMTIAGGFERVFEFSINFRNEGMDPSHLQEFQELEWYCAYENYQTGMDWTEQMVRKAIQDSIGTLKFKVFDKEGNEHEIDFSKPIPRKKFGDLLKEATGIDMTTTPISDLIKEAVKWGIDEKEAKKRSRGNLLDDIYKKSVRPKLIQPIFLTDYPADLKPLARVSNEDKNIAECYQLVIASWEVVNAYSELVNPLIQREKFEEQAKAKAGGDKEAMEIDNEFITAMEHGMPPITGWGMGIERFVTLITGQKNLRDVVLFPTMKPEK